MVYGKDVILFCCLLFKVYLVFSLLIVVCLLVRQAVCLWFSINGIYNLSLLSDPSLLV